MAGLGVAEPPHPHFALWECPKPLPIKSLELLPLDLGVGSATLNGQKKYKV